MSGKDINDKRKKVLYENGKITSAIRISKAVNARPSEKVVERFRRKPYAKMGEENE